MSLWSGNIRLVGGQDGEGEPWLKAVLVALSPLAIGAIGLLLANMAGCEGNEGSGTMCCRWLPPPFGQLIHTMCMVGGFGLAISLPLGACYLLRAIVKPLWPG